MKSRRQFCSVYPTHLSAVSPVKEASLRGSHTDTCGVSMADSIQTTAGRLERGSVRQDRSKLWAIVGRVAI